MGGATPALPLARVHPRGGLAARRARGASSRRCGAPPTAPASASSPATPRSSVAASGDKVFINTSGIGLSAPGRHLSSRRVRPGDAILLSGTHRRSRHGHPVACARGSSSRRRSRATPRRCTTSCAAMLDACPRHPRHARSDARRARRDARRDRDAAAASASRSTRRPIPVKRRRCAAPARSSASIRSSSPTRASSSPSCRRKRAPGARGDARAPARSRRGLHRPVTAAHPGCVVLRTPIGGQRALDLPFAEALPRIC